MNLFSKKTDRKSDDFFKIITNISTKLVMIAHIKSPIILINRKVC